MRKALLASILFAMSVFGADFTGNWSGEGLSDGESHPLFFVMKQDGNTLTGSGGPNADEQHPMQNGKVDGEKVVFDVPAGKGVLHFELSADGEALKGTVQIRSDEGTRSGTVSLKRAS